MGAEYTTVRLLGLPSGSAERTVVWALALRQQIPERTRDNNLGVVLRITWVLSFLAALLAFGFSRPHAGAGRDPRVGVVGDCCFKHNAPRKNTKGESL